MSRPSRYAGKQPLQVQSTEINGQNLSDPITSTALSKARAQFNEPVAQLQAIFPEWKEDDLLSLLEEVKGDIETAVARISEGHAEQWGAVKHRKDKKLPHRERERDREGHSTPRGQSNSRGRGRGGRSAGPSRQSKEKSSASLPSRPEQALNTPDEGPSTTNLLPEKVDSTQTATGIDDRPESDVVTNSTIHHTPEPPNLATSTPRHPRESQHATTKKNPAYSGMSWAQIAKPQSKELANNKSQNVPPDADLQPPRALPTSPENQREQATTVESPSWEDEPSVPDPVTTESQLEHGWVDPVPLPAKNVEQLPTETRSPTKVHAEADEQPPSPSFQPQTIVPAEENEDIPPGLTKSAATAPQLNAPPGLATPANFLTEASKPVVNVPTRNAMGTHRPGPRFKGDQAVIMPPHHQSMAAHIIGAKPLPLQFGSLNIAGDEGDTLLAQPILDTKQPDHLNVATNTQVKSPVPSTEVPIPTNPPALANNNTYEQSDQEHRPQVPMDSRDLNRPNDSPVHTQAPPINAALAVAPHGQLLASQTSTITSQHSLAGLTHVPQQSNIQGQPNHSQAQHLGQQAQLTQQQQQYDGPSIGAGGLSTNIGQTALSQAQNQSFLRHSDSPFYAAQSMIHSQDQNFGISNAGTFQGIQSAFNGGQNLTDFGYDGQRANPYDTYNPQSSFAGRNVIRPDEVKGAVAGPAQGLHQSHNASTLGTGQANGIQGQGQYPNMTHLTNPFYYNMNPYNYGNQFYSPAFTSFVNPMYAGSGHHTPPHGSKPGVGSSSNMSGASSTTSYNVNNPGHFHHSSGTFDNEGGSNGPTPYQTSSGLASDFPKGGYSSSQSFLGGIGNPSSARGSVPSTSTPESFKGYGPGANIQSGMISTDKGTPSSQPSRVPGITQGGQQQPQQPFYHGSRFQNTASNNPGFQHGPPQQQQGDGYYSGYQQRW
ncbi:hypothetical protein FRC15_002819 [Serendipita sp. 397]|nr:hypothetical protein FRC15_002819 [Serendipita sp. 397]